MAIDPNSLLIFEVREDLSKKGHNKAAETAIGIQANKTQNTTARPQQTAQPATPQRQQSAGYGTATQTYQKAQREFVQPNKTNYYAPQKEEENLYSMPVVQAPSDEMLEEGLSITAGNLGTTQKKSKKPSKKSKTEEQSREAAKGLYCVWHPWRPAYAICAYCHRPFCFEDIVESNGNYYCLEDIDKVTNQAPTEVSYHYNHLSYVSAAFLFVAAIAFYYFSGNQIVKMVNFSNTMGAAAFASMLNGPYGFLLAEVIVSILVIASAILILKQSERSFLIGVLVSFVSLSLFSYEYLNTNDVYEIYISIASFVGMLALLYSRSAYESNEEDKILEQPGAYQFETQGFEGF
ncbi:MAG: hypothetical protein ACP5TL_01875 [Candidatus Micrarchaeia archaeon]